MTQYLVVYRRSAGGLITIEDLGDIDPAAAMQKRFVVERAYRQDLDVEVVLLSASSREALMRTHSPYFRSTAQLASDLVKAVG